MSPRFKWFSPGALVVYTALWSICFLVGHLIRRDLTPFTTKTSLFEGLLVGVGMALASPHLKGFDEWLKRLFSRC